jgi:hypothetical protein
VRKVLWKRERAKGIMEKQTRDERTRVSKIGDKRLWIMDLGFGLWI